MTAFIPGVRLREAGALCARLRVEYPRGVVVGGVVGVGDRHVAVHARPEAALHERRRGADGDRRRVPCPSAAAGSGRLGPNSIEIFLP